MWLVPAEHFLYVEFEENVRGRRRAEIYTNENNSVQGMVVDSIPSTLLGEPIVDASQAYEAVTEIDSNNWSMPVLENSKLVFVADSDNKTLQKTATVNLRFESQPRTPML